MIEMILEERDLAILFLDLNRKNKSFKLFLRKDEDSFWKMFSGKVYNDSDNEFELRREEFSDPKEITVMKLKRLKRGLYSLRVKKGEYYILTPRKESFFKKIFRRKGGNAR